MSASAARPALEVTGREAELAVLAAFLREDRGRPAALVLEGEAGIGNPTIVRAALERVQPRRSGGNGLGSACARLTMYIAQARGGRFEIVESLGAIDPQERLVEAPALVG